MANGRYISYLRVSSQRQGESGLGLEAQRMAVETFLNGGRWKLAKEFVEVESGRKDDRPALDAALRTCRLQNATLIVGRLDRLARNARFLLKLVEESGKRGVIFCDLPHIPEGPAGKFMITQLAAVAEFESAVISQRTQAALEAAKLRGTALGGRRFSKARWQQIAASGRVAGTAARQRKATQFKDDIMPVITDLRESGMATLVQLADGLNERGIETSRGKGWSPTQVKRVLEKQ